MAWPNVVLKWLFSPLLRLYPHVHLVWFCSPSEFLSTIKVVKLRNINYHPKLLTMLLNSMVSFFFHDTMLNTPLRPINLCFLLLIILFQPKHVKITLWSSYAFFNTFLHVITQNTTINSLTCVISPTTHLLVLLVQPTSFRHLWDFP